MSLKVPTVIVEATTSEELADKRHHAKSWRSDEVHFTDNELTNAVLDELIIAAESVKSSSFGRVAKAIKSAREGNFKPIPRLTAAPQMIAAYLMAELADGWLYVMEKDGYVQPYLVVDVGLRKSHDTERLEIKLLADDPLGKKRSDDGTSVGHKSLYFDATDVTRKTPEQVLAGQSAYRETAEFRAEYDQRRAAFDEIANGGFAKQYRFTGYADVARWDGRAGHRTGRKVVHNLAPSELPALRGVAPSTLFEPTADADGVGPVPVRTVIPVFDLGTQDFVTVNAADLTAYRYDKSLGAKLVLPDDQRELLDILTSDITTFTADVIEGKSAGNVILGKGVPGVGKTLTAEVYSELIERPLYSVHSGSLGTKAEDIRKNLEEVFQRAKRWDAVLLLDEADVFVLERGSNIEQNAIVAEFLRTLEYFDGLLFMTTNRADHIDDAILSRCAAIIDYAVPGRDDARRVWEVQAKNNGIVLAPDLLEGLLDGFQTITPRDIKMLLRLALRVAAHRDEELSMDVFRMCAMFRGQHLVQTAKAERV